MCKRVARAVVSLTLLMAVMVGAAQADVVVIGTADIDGIGTGYKLIYDTGSVTDGLSPFVWLDYTHSGAFWAGQNAWASGLNALNAVTYHLNSGVTMDWGANNWRLPSTVDGEPANYGTNGTTKSGYNITTSEMGHLYYTVLGNLAYVDKNGTPQTGTGLINKGIFDHLKSDYWYWSGTTVALYPTYAWAFQPVDGEQVTWGQTSYSGIYGIAVRSGQLSVVPEPSTYLLLGISLGVVGYARRRMSVR